MSVYSVITETSKRCFTCKGVFPNQDFTKDSSKSDGLSIYCKYCKRKGDKAYKKSRPEKQKEYKKRYKPTSYLTDRAYMLKLRYGMTLKDFDDLFESQGRKCALCRSEKSDAKNFVVDHDHKTGVVRGILCSYCNRALGMFKDDIEVLNKAIRYLEDK